MLQIGATALPGCLTKGDLNVVVRVTQNDLDVANSTLDDRFARNVGSIRTNEFAPSKTRPERLIW